MFIGLLWGTLLEKEIEAGLKGKLMVKKKFPPKEFSEGNSLVFWWLGLVAFTAKGLGSIPGWGNSIPKVVWYSQKEKKKKKSMSPGIM